MAARCRAVTLMELLVVIALIGLLAAIVLPDYSTFGRAARLAETAQRMKALVAMCRAEAMNESQRMRVQFRLDGTVRVLRQRDPIEAPHEYIVIKEQWALIDFLLEDVWVEAVLALPEGPPPILVEDDYVEFEEVDEDIEPIPLEDLETSVWIDFEPDGSSGSLRWILRDASGTGLQMTLDGRLGRVDIYETESVDAELLARPEPLDEADEDDFVVEEEEL